MKEQAILLEQGGKKYILIEYSEEARLENFIISLTEEAPLFSYIALAIVKAIKDKHPLLVKEFMKNSHKANWIEELK